MVRVKGSEKTLALPIHHHRRVTDIMPKSATVCTAWITKPKVSVTSWSGEAVLDPLNRDAHWDLQRSFWVEGKAPFISKPPCPLLQTWEATLAMDRSRFFLNFPGCNNGATSIVERGRQPTNRKNTSRTSILKESMVATAGGSVHSGCAKAPCLFECLCLLAMRPHLGRDWNASRKNYIEQVPTP